MKRCIFVFIAVLIIACLFSYAFLKYFNPGKVEAIVEEDRLCPVTASRIVKEKAVEVFVNSHRHLLCCAGCISIFKNDPQKFISGGGINNFIADLEKKRLAVPRHPEVSKPAPAKLDNMTKPKAPAQGGKYKKHVNKPKILQSKDRTSEIMRIRKQIKSGRK